MLTPNSSTRVGCVRFLDPFSFWVRDFFEKLDQQKKGGPFFSHGHWASESPTPVG